MERSISPITFCGTLPLYTHKIVELAKAFEEDSDLLLDRFLCGFDELFGSVCLILQRFHLPFKHILFIENKLLIFMNKYRVIR